MKKFICLLFSLALVAFSITPTIKTDVAKAKDANTIVIYSWEDYIDLGYSEEDFEEMSDYLLDNYSQEELLKSIIDIFMEENPEINVEYHTFATNEEMYNELKNNPSGPDLICPSEYMIMKMKDEGLIKPFTSPSEWEENGSPYIKKVFENLDLVDGDKIYACGYMWGTMGYIYNADKTTSEELKNWDSVLNDKFDGKITIKDSIRDTYIMALGSIYKDELLALDKNATDYNEKLSQIFNRTDDESIKKVEKYLKDLKNHLYGFEVDSGKSDLLTGKIDVNFAWSGDAVYSIDEGEYEGVNLEYVVPEEGSNVWFDGFVMPTNANEELATKFLNFVSRKDNVIRNMEYIGYTSCMAQEDLYSYILESYEEEDGTESVNLGYFFKGDDYQGMDYLVKTSNLNKQLATQYPDFNTIKRCAVMDNFDNETLDKINEMWNNVKFITFPYWIIIVIVAVVLLVAITYLLIKYKDDIFKGFNKKKLKVISKEKIR